MTKKAILQRVGRGRASKLRTLYKLTPSVPVEPELDFVSNARRVVATEWPQAFARGLARAFRTAR